MDIYLGDSYLVVSGEPIPPELQKELSYWHKELKYSARERKRVVTGRTVKLFKLKATISNSGAPETVLITMPGFAYRIKRFLTNLGYSVNIIDERISRLRYNFDNITEMLRPYQCMPAAKAIMSRGGLIACPTGFGKTVLAAAIIKAFDVNDMKIKGCSTVLMVTPGIDLADKNQKTLAEFLPNRDVGLVTGSIKRWSDDVLVVTAGSLGNVDMEEVGIIIYDEVHTLTDSKSSHIMKAPKAIRYGMSATPFGKFQGSDKLIEAVFGPIVSKVTYSEAVKAGAVVPVKVLWAKTSAPKKWPQYGYHSRDANYRRGLWKNMDYHKLIDDLVRTIDKDIQTLIIVDKLEHMDSFLSLVNGDNYYNYVHGETSAKVIAGKKMNYIKAISAKERLKLYNDFSGGKIKRMISSGVYRIGVDFPQLEIVINAEGMGSKILSGQMPGRTSRLNAGKECGYIIDFSHEWDIKLNRSRNETAGDLARDDISRQNCYSSEDFLFEQILFKDMQELKDYLNG